MVIDLRNETAAFYKMRELLTGLAERFSTSIQVTCANNMQQTTT